MIDYGYRFIVERGRWSSSQRLTRITRHKYQHDR